MIRAAFVALCFSGLLAAAPGPVVRASIATPRPIIVGQAVRVNVTVLVPNYFMGEPEFPQFNMDNAIVVLPEETPQNSNETIAGQTYAGITVTYRIYPQQPGSFKLPKADVGVKYAADPPKSVEVHVPLPTVEFEAVIPPEAADLDYFLPTTSLKIAQKLDKQPKNLRVGDTVTRTVTISVSKLHAMLIPPTKFEAQVGLAVYPKQPRVDDIKTDRGEFVEGRRIDIATYLIRKDGDYTLPAIQVEWWNLDRGKVERATLPAIRFTAVPNPAANPEIPPEPEPVTETAAPKPAGSDSIYGWRNLAQSQWLLSRCCYGRGFASERGLFINGEIRARPIETPKLRSLMSSRKPAARAMRRKRIRCCSGG